MNEMWTPGKPGSPLAPPGFSPRRRIVGSPNYVLDHPTRYRWAQHVEPMVRKLYRAFGGPKSLHINTYVEHPPRNGTSIRRDYQLYSLDVWGAGGRGAAVPKWIGDAAIAMVWNDPGDPFVWYWIWEGNMYSRYVDNFAPRFFASASDPFNYHGDHVHFTFLKRGGVWF